MGPFSKGRVKMDAVIDRMAYAPGSKILFQTWKVQVMMGDLLQRADTGNYFLSYDSCHSQHFSKTCSDNIGLKVHELSYPADYLCQQERN